jgi:hypothetical protein
MLQPSSARSISSTGLFGGRAAHFGPRAGAEAAGDVGPELDAMLGDRVVQRLRVGVGDDEIDALDLGLDHVGDALPPAPPTPMTAIRGRSSSTEGGPMLMLIPCSPRGGVDNCPCRACATKRIARAKGKSNYPQCRKT